MVIKDHVILHENLANFLILFLLVVVREHVISCGIITNFNFAFPLVIRDHVILRRDLAFFYYVFVVVRDHVILCDNLTNLNFMFSFLWSVERKLLYLWIKAILILFLFEVVQDHVIYAHVHTFLVSDGHHIISSNDFWDILNTFIGPA